jgi:uncharacterized protein (TIGR02271 family)
MTMATTITAMFDSRSDAEAAKERLKAARVDADHVHIHDKSSAGFSESGYSNHEDRGFWDSVKNAFAPDEDRHTYEEGVRRGGALLTADVDDDCVDEAVRVLEEANSIDIDERSEQWRSSGWTGTPTGGTASAFGGFQRDEATRGTSEREEVIPVVEENLVVGKREVERGGVRVRSYVSEVPVHEQIRLRNERVNVQRRAVDQPLSAADADAFRERTIDMTATGEEAVIGKNARVVEEIVVSKSAEEHVESIDDTVRKTEVEIEGDDTLGNRASALGTTDRN